MNQNIVAVFTNPKPKLNSDFFPLDSLADKFGIPCYLTEDINSDKDINIINRINDIIFCFGWSRLLI